VVKIEMLEKSVLVLNNELWLRFHWDKLYDKKFIFKADSINLASVEEADFICWRNYREIVIYGVIIKSSYTLILKCLAALYFSLLKQVAIPL
jgi:hypothetical protein